MKTYVKILLIITIACGLIAWVRDSFDIGHIARTLPFCSGNDVPLSYTLGSISLVLLMFWGLRRLRKLGQDNDDQQDDSPTAGSDNDEPRYEYDNEGYYEQDRHNS